MTLKKGLLICLFALFLAANCFSAPSSKLIDKIWLQNNPQSTQTIDYKFWAYFLKKYVKQAPNGINMVAYSNVSDGDHAKLKRAIRFLGKLKIAEYNRCVQLAYWINLYNMVTVNLILDKMPVSSIRSIKSGVFSGGPWDKPLVNVDGHELTLNNIEHGILRPIYKSPLIHYAVNCASRSCPNLQLVPYTCKNGAKLLEQAARDYVNNKRGVAVVAGKAKASKIYDWYQSDFGGSEEGVINHVRKYANPELQEKLKDKKSISSYSYDWDLNGK